MLEYLMVAIRYYPLILLILAMVTLFLRGYRHLFLPLMCIVLFLGYRLYHQEHRHFMDAVKHGEIMKVRKYLSWHFNPNYSQDGSTPLILAVKNDHAEVAKLLISHGANTNTIDEQGHTPLHWAYFKGNKELIEALLQNKDPKEIQTGTPPITPS